MYISLCRCCGSRERGSKPPAAGDTSVWFLSITAVSVKSSRTRQQSSRLKLDASRGFREANRSEPRVGTIWPSSFRRTTRSFGEVLHERPCRPLCPKVHKAHLEKLDETQLWLLNFVYAEAGVAAASTIVIEPRRTATRWRASTVAPRAAGAAWTGTTARPGRTSTRRPARRHPPTPRASTTSDARRPWTSPATGITTATATATSSSAMAQSSSSAMPTRARATVAARPTRRGTTTTTTTRLDTSSRITDIERGPSYDLNFPSQLAALARHRGWYRRLREVPASVALLLSIGASF